MNKMRCFLAAIVALVVMAGCGKKVDVALGTTTLNLAAEGESVEVALTSNGDWTVDAYPDWLTVSPTSGKGDATLTLTAPLNDTDAARSGELHVSTKDNSATLTVSQEVMDKDYIIVSPESIESEAEGGDFTLTVTSNCDWAVNVPVNWLTCEPMSGTGNGTVTVSISPVEGDIELRETTIVFSGVESELVPVHVMQHAQVHVPINVEPNSVMLDYEATELPVTVSCEGSWTATSDVEWVNLSVTSGNGNANLTVMVAENEVMEARVAQVTFLLETEDYATLVIKQDGMPDPHHLEVTPETLAFSKDGGTAEIDITCDVEWTASVPVAWASLSTTSGVGDGSLVLNVESNPVSEPRQTAVTVTSDGLIRYVVVSQAAGEVPVSLTVSPDTLYAAYTGGFKHFSITSNASWSLMTPNDDWITLQTTSGTGDGEIDIIVDYNGSGTERVGVVNVIHNFTVMATVVVVQESKPNIFETDVTEINVRPEGGEYTIQLTANQSWTTNCDSEWMTCSPESGTGDCTLIVNVEALASPRPRTGTVKIVGSTGAQIYVTVNQHERD
jgi:hypothetical protein